MTQFLLPFSLFISVIFSPQLSAEPWVDTSDVYLKTNIQHLADTGFIKTPTTTYPLMWSDIGKDLANIDIYKFDKSERAAYQYIKNQLRLAKENKSVIKVATSSAANRFNSFGDKQRDKHTVQIQKSFMSDNFALNLSPTFIRKKNSDGESKTSRVFDGSYIAAGFGNWVVSYGSQNRWFGPMWDSSTSLSNNARPLQGVTLNRRTSAPLSIPFTDIDIPWTITTFLGSMENERSVEDALVWNMRLNFKPLKHLEIGLTRMALWGGKGQSQSLSDFSDVIVSKQDCLLSETECLIEANSGANESQHALQQSSVDVRLSLNFMHLPVAVYGSYLYQHDENTLESEYLSEKASQVGIDARMSFFNINNTAFLEHSNTAISCSESTTNNCYNEHSLYQTGFRYHGRSINHLYDNDAKTTVFGVISQFKNGLQLTNKLRFLELNKDNSDKNPLDALIGNPLSSEAEQLTMLSTSLQYSYQAWRFNVGVNVSRSEFDSAGSDDSKSTHFNLSIEHIL